MSGMHLGVNIDHVATVRQARGTRYPDPLHAALLAEQSGADSITLHLREDRRHIQDADVRAFRAALQTRMNLEMAATDEMLRIAQEIRPQDCCLVPERRNEVTTEGGLDVLSQESALAGACSTLAAAGIRVSIFIDPDARQLDAARRVGAPVVELHTGSFADAQGATQARELAIAGRSSLCGQARFHGARRSRPALPQRAGGRGDPRDRRVEHRPRDHRARAAAGHGICRCGNEAADVGGAVAGSR